MNNRFLLTFFLLAPLTRCASEHTHSDTYAEMQRIITLKLNVRTAIIKCDQKAFVQILDEHPHLLLHATGEAKPDNSDHSVLSQALECDMLSVDNFFIPELLKRGAPLQAYALSYQMRKACKSICEDLHELDVFSRMKALRKFYDLVKTMQLPEELKFTDITFGEITTAQQYLQASASQFLNLHLWHCNYCEGAWTFHKKPNLDYLKRLAAAVELTQDPKMILSQTEHPKETLR